MLESINFELTVIGHTNTDNWECIKFNARINGMDFDYHVGMAYAKKLENNKGYTLTGSEIKKIRESGYTMRTTINVKKSNIVGNVKVFQVPALVKAPSLESILHGLFLDSEAHENSFSDWCDNFGYDNDSIKARKTYDECIENYFKLKKALGAKYTEVETYIQKLEL